MHIASMNNARHLLADDGYSLPAGPLKEQHAHESGGLPVLSLALISREMMQPPLFQLMSLTVMVWSRF